MKVACVQINSGAGIAENISKLDTLVGNAAAQGAQFISLPENAFLMDIPGTPRILYTEDSHPGRIASADMARKYACWLLAGSIAVDAGNGKTFNRSLLFDPEGNIAARYDKIHLFDVDLPGGETYAESSRFVPGNKAVLAEMPIPNPQSLVPKLGMTVCYDLRFPHLYRALSKSGAHILAVPAAFTQTTGEAHWHVLLRARAIENGAFVVAAAQTGTHPGGRKTYGHALIVDPWGKVIADAGKDEGVIVVDIDIGMVAQIRARLPNLRHDREFA